jgi:hypothetical protein
MNTQTFVETHRNRVAKFNTSVTVERTPATLSEHRARRGRWFDFVGDHVTECFKVKATFTSLNHTTRHDGVTHPSGGSTWTDEYFEIVTPAGRGLVYSFQDGDELIAFIPNTGKALIEGCWKKYGKYRGHGVGYMRANRLNVNSKAKVDHTCPSSK